MDDEQSMVMVPLHIHTMLVVDSMDLGLWPMRPIKRAILIWAINAYHQHMAERMMMAEAVQSMGESPSASVN